MPITLPKPIVGTDGRMITAVIPQLTLPKPSAPPPAPIPNPYTGIAEEVVDPYAGIADEITPATVKQPDPYAGIADEILPAPIAPQPAFPAPLAPISPVASVVPPIAPPVEKNWQDAMLGSNWMSVLPFVGSAKEAADSINILALANRIEKGEGSPEDERTLNAFIIDSQTPRTWGYNLTKGLLQLPAFAIELGLTGGTYTAGKAVGTQALKKGLLKYAGSKAGKAAIWVGGRAVGVAAQTAVAAAPRIVTGTVQNITPEIGMDAAGEITFKHNEDNLLKAAFRSYGEQYLQVGSERFGNLLDRTGAGKLFQNSLRKYLKINPSKRVEDFMNIVRNKALRNSFVAETIEEEIIKPAEVLTGMGTQLRGEENTMAARFHEQYSWSQFLQQSLILAVPTLGGAVINRLGTPVKPMSPKWTSTDDYHARLKSIGLTDSQIGNFDQQLALAKSPEETTEITERLAAQFSDTIAPPVEAPIAPAAPKVAPAPVEGVAPVPAPAVAEIPPVPEVVAKPGVKPPELMTSDVAKKLGYNVGPVWHGTYADKFNEFLPWSHFGHKSTALERVEQDEVRGSRPVGSHRLEQVYLKLNPLRVKAEAAWSTEGPFTGLLQELKKNGIITQAESADILRKYDAPLKRIDLVATETEKNQLREQSKKIWQNLIENALSKKGYDGLVYRDQGSFGDSFVVFHPEQIKPAETEPPLPPPAPPTPIKVETPAPAPADVTDTQLPLETRAGTILPEARPEVAKRPELMTPESKADFREKSLVVQKKIDDLETLLIKKHGKDYFNDAIAYEIAKKENDLKIVQAIKSKYGDDVKTLDAIERLVKDRNVVDDAEIDSFIHTVVISSQLPKSETRQALEELGIGKGNLSENYYKWDTHHTHILDTLYGHFMKGEGWAKFVWGGTGDNPKIQAAFFNEDGIQTRPNREAALKTIATYDAMAEANGSPSLRDIAGGELVQDLPKQLKQPAAPEVVQPLSPPPTQKPTKEGVMAPRTPEVGAGVVSKVEPIPKPIDTGEIRVSRRPSEVERPKGVPSKQGQYLVDEMMKAWENQPAGGAMVMQSESDLDALGLSNESRKAILDSKAEGFYHIPTETVVIIADNLQRPSDAIRVMLHESIGHFGIRKVLGAEFDTELERLGKLIPAADLQKAIDTYGEDLAVEEYLAKEAPLRNPTLWQQFIKAVRAALQRIGVDPNILNKWDTRGEIDKLIDTARDWMERGEAKPAAPVAGEVRLAGPDTREYKLETETPDQWRSRATLEKQNAEAKRQSDLLKEKAAEPIKGGMGDTTGSLFKGETDLFGVRLSRREHGPAKLERQKLTSEVIDRLGDQMYRQGVNEEQVDKGRQYIEDKGIDQATLDFYSRKNDLTAPDRQVLGWMLAEQHDIAVEEAVRTGDKKAEELHAALSVDILDQMNDWATEFGQAGQTFAIWNNTLEIPAAARMKFKKVVKSFVDMKMNNADIQEAVRKLNEENAPAIDETLQEDYVQERIADVIHKMGVRAFNGMPDRMKKASYMQGVQDFLSRPENVEADTTDIRFAGGEVSLDMKIDKAARYGVGVLAKQGNTSFSAFSEAMTKKYGPNIEKYLPRIYDQSGVLLDQAGMQGAPKAKGADTRVGRSANAAIKTALKQWFAADVNVGREPILDLLKEVGLTEKEAVSLVMGVQQKFIERANKAKMRAVSKMTTGRRVSLNNQKAIKRLLDLSNITPLSDPIVRDAIAKAYGLPEMTPELGAKLDAMAKAIKAAPEGSPTDNAVRVMLDFMRKQMPRDDMDVGWAMWYSQILSGYQTAERNFIGTALNAFDNLATSMIVEPKNAGFALVGFSHGLKAGMSAAGNVLKTGIFPARGGKFEMSSTLELDPFTGYFKFFNNWKFVLRSLQAADMLFFKASQESRAMMIAADIVRSKGARDNADLWQQVAKVMGTTEVRAFMRQATELEGLQGVEAKARTQELAERQRPAIMQAEPLTYAQQSTFNHPAEGMLGVFSRTIRDLTRKVPFGRTIIPFTQIVANVTNVSLDHTPWGFVRAWKGMKDSSGVSQPITGHRRAQLLAKATMGTAAMVAAYALDKIGGDDDEGNKLFEITGAGTGDFNKDNQMKETGWRPWSIRIRGGSYWDYRLSPMAIGFAIIGSMRDAERYKKLTEVDLQSRLAYAMLNSGSVIYNMSFLSGVDQVAKLIEVGSPESSKRKAYAYLERLGSSVAVPALLKQIDRTFDPNVHDNSTIMEGVLREIPIASRLARPKLNMLGEPIKQTTGPVSIFFSKSMSDPVWKLIVDKEAFISKPSTSTELKYFDQATCKQVVSRMTEDEYYRYVEESGKAIRQQIERSLTFLQGAKQDIVEKRIDGFVQIARNRVKNQITRDRRNNESQAPPR